MKAISKEAQAVVEQVIAGMPASGGHRKVGPEGKAIMALTVETLPGGEVSLAHYYRQNGDAMRDPEIVLWKGPDGRFYPVEITQDNVGLYRRLVEFKDGKPARWMPRAQADAATFMGTWMRNVREQQKDALAALRAELKAAARMARPAEVTP
jgi:hypothetical protein